MSTEYELLRSDQLLGARGLLEKDFGAFTTELNRLIALGWTVDPTFKTTERYCCPLSESFGDSTAMASAYVFLLHRQIEG